MGDYPSDVGSDPVPPSAKVYFQGDLVYQSEVFGQLTTDNPFLAIPTTDLLSVIERFEIY